MLYCSRVNKVLAAELGYAPSILEDFSRALRRAPSAFWTSSALHSTVPQHLYFKAYFFHSDFFFSCFIPLLCLISSFCKLKVLSPVLVWGFYTASKHRIKRFSSVGEKFRAAFFLPFQQYASPVKMIWQGKVVTAWKPWRANVPNSATK